MSAAHTPGDGPRASARACFRRCTQRGAHGPVGARACRGATLRGAGVRRRDLRRSGPQKSENVVTPCERRHTARMPLGRRRCRREPWHGRAGASGIQRRPDPHCAPGRRRRSALPIAPPALAAPPALPCAMAPMRRRTDARRTQERRGRRHRRGGPRQPRTRPPRRPCSPFALRSRPPRRATSRPACAPPSPPRHPTPTPPSRHRGSS